MKFLCYLSLSVLSTLFLANISIAADFPIDLNYNFNGMVHTGEAGQPDDPDGFRSISDRALIIDGNPGSFSDATGASGIPYHIVDAADTLDIVHIGNRNTVDSGNHEFDDDADGDELGIQPSWLTDVDQSTTINPVAPPIEMTSSSRVGILYNISNGGGDFDVTLNFSDASSVTVTLNGPDWYGPFAGTPDSPGNGVSLQQNLGTFSGSGNVDMADPDATLIVTEAVIAAADLLSDLGFDVAGRQLTEIVVGNRTSLGSGYAVYAITVADTLSPVSSIPTMTEYGIFMLMLLAGSSAVYFLRRKSRIQSP